MIFYCSNLLRKLMNPVPYAVKGLTGRKHISLIPESAIIEAKFGIIPWPGPFPEEKVDL